MRINTLLLACVAASLLTSLSAAQSSRLNKPSAFDTRDTGFSELYQRIYLGRFDEMRADRLLRGDLFQTVYSYSVAAYGSVCPHTIAEDSPTVAVTRTTEDGWGNRIDSRTHRYLVDTRFAAKANEYGMPFLRDVVGEDILQMITRNGCLDIHTIQYLENLLRYAYGKPSVQEQKPEPIARYRLRGEDERANRKASGETVRLDIAMNMAMDARYLDRSPNVLAKMYAERARYFKEAAALDDVLGSTMVLACRYVDPSGSTASHAYYYWQNPKPVIVTDAWRKSLSPDSPFAKIGTAREKCPTKEPHSEPHPVDVRARLPVSGS